MAVLNRLRNSNPAMNVLVLDEAFMSGALAAVGLARAGVPVPDERPADTDAEIAAGIDALGLPVVVKGSMGRGGAATVIADSVARARRAAGRMRARGTRAFLQAHVDGPTFLAGGLFDCGEPVRFYAGEKVVQFPSRTGPAAELRSTGDAELVAAAKSAFKSARVSGIASVDFIRDSGGRFHFLELNPRPWGSIAAVREAGVDLFSPLVDMWRGVAITPSLDYTIGKQSPVFPVYLLSRRYRTSGRAISAIESDAINVIRAARESPSLAFHFALRSSG